jgi:hypothetical protein
LSRVPHALWGTETPWRELAGLTNTGLPFLDCPNYSKLHPRYACRLQLNHYLIRRRGENLGVFSQIA